MMPTEKIYDTQPYTYGFTANVLSCEEKDGAFAVTLDRTAFFHEGGGQDCDTGKIGGGRVTYVYEEDETVYHICDRAVAGRVECSVDSAPRFSRMQNHTAEHIVSGIIHSLFGYDNVGFHLGDDRVTLDINGRLTDEELGRVERTANEAVWKNLPVSVRYLSPDEIGVAEYRSKKEIKGRVRIVTVEGVDTCACCAPHVERTGEIGMIKLIDPMNYKGGTRVFLLAGDRALSDYGERYSQTHGISVMLSAKQEEILGAVRRLEEELENTRAALSQKKKEIAGYIVKEAAETAGDKVIFTSGLDGGSIRRVVNSCVERDGALCALFSLSDGGGYDYMISGGSIDLRALAQDINRSLDARGGGNDLAIQGHINETEDAIRSYLAQRTDKGNN